MGANFNFNKVILGGRLTADPELKTTPNGHSVVSFSIAVTRKHVAGKESESDFFRVTAWNKTAEFVSRYFKKGASICVVGSLQVSSWTNQNGEKHFSTDIIADEVTFVDSKEKSDDNAPAFTPPENPKWEEVKDDDFLPF